MASLRRCKSLLISLQQSLLSQSLALQNKADYITTVAYADNFIFLLYVSCSPRLIGAAFNGHAAIVKLLIKEGADVDSDGDVSVRHNHGVCCTQNAIA
jgi:hypothetical protein